jgi:uncharacterized protein involved in exopolysaccharide biosynthesis
MAARRRGLFLPAFLAVLTPVALWALLTPPSYEASLRLLVKGAGDSGRRSQPASQEQIAVAAEGVRNPSLLRKVAKERELAVEELDRDVRVAPVPDSSLISIAYANEDPELAAAVVNTLAELYLEVRSEAGPKPDPRAPGDEQIPIYELAVKAARRELADFQQRNGIALAAGQRRAAMTAAAEIEGQKVALETRIGEAETRFGLLRRQAGALRAGAPLRALVDELEAQRGELGGRYQPGHTLTAEVEQRLAAAAPAFEKAQSNPAEAAPAAATLREAIDADLMRAQNELAGLRARHVEIQGALRTAGGRQVEIERLTARRAELEDAVRVAEASSLRRQQAAEIALKAGGESAAGVSVVAPAEVPAAPDDERQSTILLLGLLAALVAAFAAVSAYDARRRPVAFVADIATATGAPVLMMIEESQSHVS